MDKQTRSDRKEFAVAHYKKWQESGLSKNEYCRQNNLKATTFTGWKRYLNSYDNKKLTKIPAKATTGLTSEKAEIELKINDSLSIILEQNFNGDLLKEVLQELGVLK